MWTKRSRKHICLGNVVCSAAALCRYFLLEPRQKHCLLCLPARSSFEDIIHSRGTRCSRGHEHADRWFSVTPGSWPPQTRRLETKMEGVFPFWHFLSFSEFLNGVCTSPCSPTIQWQTSVRRLTNSSSPWSSGPRGSLISPSCRWTIRSSFCGQVCRHWFKVKLNSIKNKRGVVLRDAIQHRN